MKAVLARMLPLTALGALLAVFVYGFYSRRLFSQVVWSPQGGRRFAFLLLLYTVAFIALTVWRRALLVPFLLLMALAYAAASVGVMPLVAVAYFLFSSLILGRAIQALLRGPRPSAEATDSVVALLLGLSAYVWLIGFLVRYPVNYGLTYVALFAIPIVWRPRLAAAYVRGWVSKLGALTVKGGLAQAAQWMVGFLFLAHWLVALKPEVSSDGLAMHLAIPAAIADFHRFPFHPRDTAWAVMPMNGDWGFTAVYMLGGEYAARLFNFTLFVLTAALVGRVVRSWLSAASTLLIVGLLASTPLVQFLNGSLMVENTWTVLLIGALLGLCLRRQEGSRQALLSGAILCGTAVAAKLWALVFAAAMAPLAVLPLMRMARAREPGWRTTAALGALAFVFCAVPPYLQAYWQTGNPAFPFFNDVFRSPYFDSTAPLLDGRFLTPLHWTTLFDLTYETSRYLESQDGAMGFQYLLLLPLSFLLLRRDWPHPAKAALWVSVVSFLLEFGAASNLRYAYPALVMSMLPIAALLAQAKSSDRILHWSLCGTSIVSLALNVYFLPASGWYHKNFFLNTLRSRAELDHYIEESAPVRRLIEYVNEKNSGAPVVFIETDQIAGVRSTAYTNGWRSPAFVRRLATAQSASDCLTIMKTLGVRYVIAPTEQSAIVIRQVPLRSFLLEHTRPEFQYGRYYVARVEQGTGQETRAPSVEPLREATAGVYDDGSTYIAFAGPWYRDTQFKEPVNGTLTYADQPGASFRLAFHGSRIVYVYTKASNRGIASLTVDEQDKGEVDLYSATTMWRVRSTIGNLPPGRHVLTVRILARKHPSSSGRYVDVDALEVR